MMHFATAHSCGLRRAPPLPSARAFLLCHSAFVRVATRKKCSTSSANASLPQRIRAGCDEQYALFVDRATDFATAHSCGLRPVRKMPCITSRPFATAHSCGLRRPLGLYRNAENELCHSAFVRVATPRYLRKNPQIRSLPQRIRAGCDFKLPLTYPLQQTLPQRIRAGCDALRIRQFLPQTALPQRIRAGCDGKPENQNRSRALCHSAFVRVATLPRRWSRCQDSFATAHSCGLRPKRCINSFPAMPLCHSAFVRVATKLRKAKNIEFDLCHSAFVRVATRHLQAPPRHSVFATAHSCGLRHANSEKFIAIIHLCHSAFVRVATWRICRGFHRGAFATAHSCGLRRDKPYVQYGIAALCHSAFVRVATRLCGAKTVCIFFATAHSCGLRLP